MGYLRLGRGGFAVVGTYVASVYTSVTSPVPALCSVQIGKKAWRLVLLLTLPRARSHRSTAPQAQRGPFHDAVYSWAPFPSRQASWILEMS